jgi:hypothetical protein
MKKATCLLIIATSAFSAQPTIAQVPQLLNYQGRVTTGGTNFDGTAQFKFALVNAAGSTNYWSNDGRVLGQPETSVTLTVTKGLYSVILGDTSVSGMTYSVSPLIFTNLDVRLRVWFNDGAAGFQQFAPDQRITAVGYALVAANIDPAADVRGRRLLIGAGHILSGVNATITGGYLNGATNDYAMVGGGRGNFAGGIGSTASGGLTNIATGLAAAIAGGERNTASGEDSTIGGGYGNQASGIESAVFGGELNNASGVISFVGGGYGNIARGYAATVSGGFLDGATNNYATVAGGLCNVAGGAGASVSGGMTNTAIGFAATISGGEWNLASGVLSSVGGGYGNQASGYEATVAGGELNSASGVIAFVGGGYGNLASGYAATVPGGFANLASGQYSFAAGAGAVATNDGSFVWADASSSTAVRSTANNQFTARCAGGVRFYANANATVGVHLPAGGNGWSVASDRTLKENFKPVDTRDILAKVVATPVTEWNLISQDPAIRHIGPMAQDFMAAFAVGEDDRHISSTDADGVAFAAIQGLDEVVKEKDARIAELERRLSGLEAKMQQLGLLLEQTPLSIPLNK